MKLEEKLARQQQLSDVGHTAVKLAFVLNGAAALALIAMVANLVPSQLILVKELSVCIFIFGCGALFAAYASVTSFMAGWGEGPELEVSEFSSAGKILYLLSFFLFGLPPLAFVIGLVKFCLILSSLHAPIAGSP